ncbi:MAG TPA: hypothetical protein VFO87_06555 [Nitrospira sp.]|nr:hypothetical protein [Nitrospira sp.]
MKAVIQKLNVGLSYCDAETENDILVVFRLPADSHFHVGDVLDVDLFSLDSEQTMRNLTRNTSHRIIVKNDDIHDLRLLWPWHFQISISSAPTRACNTNMKAEPCGPANSLQPSLPVMADHERSAEI